MKVYMELQTTLGSKDIFQLLHCKLEYEIIFLAHQKGFAHLCEYVIFKSQGLGGWIEHRQAVLDGKQNKLATQVTLYGWQQGLKPSFPDPPQLTHI